MSKETDPAGKALARIDQMNGWQMRLRLRRLFQRAAGVFQSQGGCSQYEAECLALGMVNDEMRQTQSGAK